MLRGVKVYEHVIFVYSRQGRLCGPGHGPIACIFSSPVGVEEASGAEYVLVESGFGGRKNIEHGAEYVRIHESSILAGEQH
jgi:hypothetical protein